MGDVVRSAPVAIALSLVAPGCLDDAATGTASSSSTSSGAGGGGGAQPGPAPDQVAAAAELAAKDCEAFQRCLPHTFRTTFVDAADCAARGAVFWAALMFGPDSGATLESVMQCGSEVSLLSCDAWWLLNFGAGSGACKRTGLSHCDDHRVQTHGAGPDSCFPRGLRGAGALCGHGTQCESGICHHEQAPGIACSACPAVAEEQGDRCGDGIHCRGALVCEQPVCETLGQEGEACGLCLPNLLCFGGICRERREEGGDCDPDTAFLSQVCAADLLCDPGTETCVALEQVALGERCGRRADGSTARCALGGACKLSEEPDQATCIPRIPLGGACSTGYLFGNGCEPPADCVDGFCQLRGPGLCP